MARPKGSKNKKSTVPSAKAVEKIAAQQKILDTLHKDLDAATSKIKDLQADVKTKKAEIRKAEKEMARLVVEKEKSEAIEAAAAQKAEIEKVVTELISRGKSPEEILSQLK